MYIHKDRKALEIRLKLFLKTDNFYRAMHLDRVYWTKIFQCEDRPSISHRIHGAAIYGNMDPINIPPMLAYIPYMDPMGYVIVCKNQMMDHSSVESSNGFVANGDHHFHPPRMPKGLCSLSPPYFSGFALYLFCGCECYIFLFASVLTNANNRSIPNYVWTGTSGLMQFDSMQFKCKNYYLVHF